MEVGQVGGVAPILDHLIDTARGQPAFRAEPEPRVLRSWVSSSHSNVAVDVTGSLGADGQDLLTTPLRSDAHHARSEVHVGQLGIVGVVSQSGHAFESHAGVEEEPDYRSVP